MARNWPWIALAVSCAAYLIISLADARVPFHPDGSLSFFDLRVYRGGGHLVLNGASLYDTPILRFNFTYPPVAALLFVPLTVLPLAVAKIAVTMVSVAALVGVLWLALQLPSTWRPRRTGTSNRALWPVVALGVAAALWLEPITTTLAYGQINLVIALLVLFDLSQPDHARTKGAMIGLAAGLKLTPLLFVPYLFFAGRRRAASVALASFGATIAIGYALLPADSARYWGGLFLDPKRAGGIRAPSDQSLHGVLLRLAPSIGHSVWWLALAAIIGAAGLALAVLASRRGDEAMGFSVCALTGLLVSPVSWNHHWALGVPALFMLAVSAYRRRSRPGLVAAAALAAIGYCYSIELIDKSHPQGRGLNALGQLAASPYVLVGIAVIAVVAFNEYRARTARVRRATVAASIPGMTEMSPKPLQG